MAETIGGASTSRNRLRSRTLRADWIPKPNDLETLQMEEKSIMHYRSTHKILLVGEGDFSFSLCLAWAFGTAFNMVSTSLDSRVSLGQKYSHALINVTALEVLGCTIFHEMDVYTMKDDPRLKHKKFDRIINNFPHVGFICAENTDYQIRLNKKLVSGFLRNAKHMLNINGEIHITHKTTHPFTDWNIKELASQEDLDFVEEVIFRKMFYPGYYNKRGSGSRCNQNFRIGKSSTFKFTIVMDPKEAQANYEQEEYKEEYLSKRPKIRDIVMDPEEAQANYEQEEYKGEYLCKGPKIQAIGMDLEEVPANYEQEYKEEYLSRGIEIQTIAMDAEEAQANYEREEYEEEYLIKRPKIRAIAMDPEKAQDNYEREEYKEEYLSKGSKIQAKQNSVWLKWLRHFFRCFCG